VVLFNNTSGVVYDVCVAMSDEEVSYDDFQALIEAIYNDDCNEAMNVKTTFSMSHEDFNELAYTYEIVDSEGSPLVFYRSGAPSPIGAGAILVYGNDGDFPVKMGDYLQIWTSGSPKDIIIEVGMEGCDPYDDKCDAMCSYEEAHVCDPLCYVPDEREDVQCDIDCVDQNDNHVVDAGDLDGICDLDCYNDDLDPKRAYDPDCVDVDNTDGICDPDSQGVTDGRCDPDCAPVNHHCDFDCDGTVYAGNPNGFKDDDCYECDGICNGFCSYDCTFLDKDPDCPAGFTDWFELTECCGNSKCGIGENCETCTDDCPVDGDCGDLGADFFCCPDAVNADMSGCAELDTGKLEGETCSCQPECSDVPEKLVCNGPAGDKHCCPAGEVWNGTECKLGGDVLIVAIKANLESVYDAGQIASLESKINDEFINALAADGLEGSFFYLDDEDMMDDVSPNGWVTNPGDWNDIDKILDGLIPKMKSKYLIIIGGYRTFPFPEFSTSPCNDPSYSIFQTDDPYGDFNPIDGTPDIPVGRIPDPNDGDMNVIISALDTYIDLHESNGLDLNDYVSVIMPNAFSGCPCASSGTCFNENTFGISCFEDRCRDAYSDFSVLSGHEFAMILMHGSDTAPQYFIYDPPCGGSFRMDANEVPVLNVQNSVWMVMSCYSTFLKNKAETRQSIPMQFLAGGGAVYFGGSLTQLGGTYDCVNCPPNGDTYVGSLYQFVAENYKGMGERIGDAYLTGKKKYLSGILADKYSCNYRQGHENMMFGDPTLRIKATV